MFFRDCLFAFKDKRKAFATVCSEGLLLDVILILDGVPPKGGPR
jgi:hypothetical protein